MGLFSKLKDSMAKVQQENRENTRVKTAPSEIFDRIRNKIEEAQKEVATKKTQNQGRSIFDILKGKFEEAKQENEASPTEPTADKSILQKIEAEMKALEKKKKLDLEEKETNPPAWGTPAGAPVADDILSRVIEGAKKEQAKAKTKPTKEEDFGSIFDQIMNSDKPSASKAKVSKEPDYGDIWEKVSTQEAANKSRPTASGRKSTGLYVGGTGLVDGKGGSLAMRVDHKMGAGQLRKRLPDNVNVRILDHTTKNAINLDGKKTGWYKVEYEGQQGWILDSYLE